jgi:hypothetical protein
VTSVFYDAEAVAEVLGRLKKLQRVLGEFNDSQVQAERLLELARAAGEGGAPAGVLVAVGRLARDRRHRGAALRAEAFDVLARFGRGGARSACRRAFKHLSRPERGR